MYELVASDQVAVNCTGYDGLVLKIHTVGVGKPFSVIKRTPLLRDRLLVLFETLLLIG